MRRYHSLVFCCLALWGLLDARAADAVPAFARREGVPCQMCHFRPPELNADGWAYLRRGLREEPPDKGGEAMGGGAMGGGAMAATGVPAAATPRPLGEALPLQWANYLSIMGHHLYVLQRGERPTFDAGVLDLWVGGPLNRHLSGLANPSFDIQNGGSDVGQGYGQYITHWGPRFGSARLGQVLPFAILLNGGDPQMALSTPVMLATPGGSGSNWTPDSFVRGLELGYVEIGRWNLYGGVGQPDIQAGDPPFGGRSRRLRQGQAADPPEKHTDYYASADYLFTPEGDSVTLFGYWGSAWLSDAAPSRSFHRIGAFGNVYLPQIKLTGGYLTGTDEAADGRNLDAPGFFLQAEGLISDRWAAYGRYDWFRRDLAAGGSQRISGPTAGVTWWAETQVRLTLEGQLLSVTGSPQQRTLMSEFYWIF